MNLDELPQGYRLDADGVARRQQTASPTVMANMRGAHTTAEKVWQARVINLARLNGWAHYHTRDSRRSPAGFPDLVLVRDRVIYAELKTTSGKLSQAQTEWLDRLTAAGAETYVWRPEHDLDVQQALA